MAVKNARASSRGCSAEFASQAERLCALGCTDAELAEFFEVAQTTIDHWQARVPGFARAVNRGRRRAGESREPSLYRRAIGYTQQTATPFFPKRGGRPVVVMTEEHVPPETQAALGWLRMHFPNAWGVAEGTAQGHPRPAQRRAPVIVLPDNGRGDYDDVE